VIVTVVLLTLAFAATNGFHDSANAVAALVATRAARPGPALALVAFGHLAGPLLIGTAVADTVAGVVSLPHERVLPVVGAAVMAAIVWNAATWWRGPAVCRRRRRCTSSTPWTWTSPWNNCFLPGLRTSARCSPDSSTGWAATMRRNAARGRPTRARCGWI